MNPLGIGLGLGAAAIGAFFLVGTLRLPHPFGGEVVLYRGPLATAFEEFKERRDEMREEAMNPGAVPDCSGLLEGFNALKGFDNFFLDITGIRRNGARIQWDEASRRGCAWVRDVPRP